MIGHVIHSAPHRRGSILMEFVMVAPIILLLVSMVLQFAHVWTARQMTAYAAYCATRAIMAVPPGEQEAAARKAAELACAWMSMVGRHGGVASDRNVSIPGWGTIPGSDSAEVRVQSTKIVSGYNGEGLPVAAVTVKFKFPLVLPLAGRMISWAANRDGAGAGLSKFDYGHHKLKGGNNPAWAGQEVVMNESGAAEVRSEAHNSSSHLDGKFPFIELVETCVLPMPYSTARFPANGYRYDLLRGEGL